MTSMKVDLNRDKRWRRSHLPMDCNLAQVQRMKSLKADTWTSDCLDADIKSMPNNSGLWLIFTNSKCLCRLKADRDILTVQTTARYRAEVPNWKQKLFACYGIGPKQMIKCRVKLSYTSLWNSAEHAFMWCRCDGTGIRTWLRTKVLWVRIPLAVPFFSSLVSCES